MRIELLNTGSELMLGRTLNTHQQFLCRRLADQGYTVDRQVAIDDSAPAIRQAVADALGVADLIIVTGGLGPTSDDRTRDLIAELLRRPLHEDPAVLENIERFFKGRGRPLPVSTRIQAQVPQGAVVLANAHGTAPGLVMEVAHEATGRPPSLLVMLPGPPRELHPMFLEQVVPLLLQRLPLEVPFVCRTLKTAGLGESLVEERIAGPLAALVDAGLEIGYCAHVGAVDLRFAARGAQASERVAEAEGIARSLLGNLIYGVEDDLLESVLVHALTARRQTLSLAESCTGGFIAHLITNVPGASAVLHAGFVTYSNEAKTQGLGVRPETLAAHGAVSEAVAVAMAEGARQRSGTDHALSVTGIAGPGGGTKDKPVGTVWMAWAGPDGTVAQRKFNPFDRATFKAVTALQALDLLRRQLASPAG